MEDRKIIETAFYDDQKLRKRIFDAIDTTPQLTDLVCDIARYVHTLRKDTSRTGDDAEHEQPALKKRKLENGVPPPENAGSSAQEVIFEVRDVSFSIPQRKKLHLEVARGDCSGDGLVPYTFRAKNPTSHAIEYETSASTLKHVLCLPGPERPQKQYNYCLLPTYGLGDRSFASYNGSRDEPLLWTVNDGPLKTAQVLDPELEKEIGRADGDVLEKVIEYSIGKGSTPCGTSKVVRPDDAEFVSAVPEAHRKGEKAYHVKAFRGSKDGYLFFLPTGIFFGFKKPLLFFAFQHIQAISYTSVLQRTFNLSITYKIPDAAPEDGEQEFSMLDQADFAGIDAYIKRHGLQDASMAEARRAKLANVNGKRGASAHNGDSGEEPGELQKAQQEIEDEEDEEEEDYDPGSEGHSDGSGASSEEDEDRDADRAGIEGNLVQDELGSEAEEVEPDPDDEDQC